MNAPITLLPATKKYAAAYFTGSVRYSARLQDALLRAIRTHGAEAVKAAALR